MVSSIIHGDKKKSEWSSDWIPHGVGLLRKENLNVLPLESSDALIGMNWLENHWSKVDCYKNFLECIDGEGMPRLVRGIPKQVSIRHI